MAANSPSGVSLRSTQYWEGPTEGVYRQDWFSVDNSHLRLVVKSADPSNGAATYPTSNTWTIYLPDGSRVEHQSTDLGSIFTYRIATVPSPISHYWANILGTGSSVGFSYNWIKICIPIGTNGTTTLST